MVWQFPLPATAIRDLLLRFALQKFQHAKRAARDIPLLSLCARVPIFGAFLLNPSHRWCDVAHAAPGEIWTTTEPQ
jgi:hypothetical protein